MPAQFGGGDDLNGLPQFVGVLSAMRMQGHSLKLWRVHRRTRAAQRRAGI
jgi:hypothetical protein